MSEEVQANNQAQPSQPAATPAVAENTGKTADGREAFIPRDRFDAVNEDNRRIKLELEQLTAWKREKEQAELSEMDRLKTQLSELEPFRAQAENLNQIVEQAYQRELESVPEDKRDLIQGKTTAEKFQDLMRLKALGLFAAQQQQQPPKAAPVPLDSQTGAAQDGNKGTLPDTQSRLAAIAEQQGYKIDQQRLAERIAQAKRGGKNNGV